MTIADQYFSFLICYRCQGLNYFWRTKDQYFFDRKLHVVLHEPEILGNVGAIMRLTAAFNLQLHLIEPFGFIFSQNWLKRTSANHLDLAKVQIYSDWKHFQTINGHGVFVFTSAHGTVALDQFNFSKIIPPVYLVFGCESQGLPNFLKDQYRDSLLYIRQNRAVRSINLANAVSIFVFAALNQYRNLGF